MTELPDTAALPATMAGPAPASASPGFAGSAVVCSGLTYRFGAHTAVDHVDLRISAGAGATRYEVDALRGLLIGTPDHLGLDLTVLVAATVVGVTAAAALLPRLAR